MLAKYAVYLPAAATHHYANWREIASRVFLRVYYISDKGHDYDVGINDNDAVNGQLFNLVS